MKSLVTLIPNVISALADGLMSVTDKVGSLATNNPKLTNGAAAVAAYSFYDPSYWRATFDLLMQAVSVVKHLF